MDNYNVLAIDLAKNIFQVCAMNNDKKEVFNKKMTRKKFEEFISNIDGEKNIYMEACGSSNYWGRVMQAQNHNVNLINPIYVKAFVTGNKNDKNDSRAIAAAAYSPSVRFIKIKSIEQQNKQNVLKIYELIKAHRTATLNQARGLLSEYGIVTVKGTTKIIKLLQFILDQNSINVAFEDQKLLMKIQSLSPETLNDFKLLYDLILSYVEQMNKLKKQMKEQIKLQITKELQEEKGSRYDKIKNLLGVGDLSLYTLMAIGNLNDFSTGRHFAAYLGLVPKENSSGGKYKLGKITKKGNSLLREFLVHGARSCIIASDKKTDKRSKWIKNLQNKKHFNVVAVALANKNARIIWSIFTKNEEYNENKAFA